ncbi:TlpA disulfide reductase family protein [Flavivirga aquimarina]|uniref:TlpA disulfide reductase family protein n=1 Tax=Flavivirga aquimarina TaxID=2027862 RepID=A0ABT8WD23_9FLAO|nr:TlpA disulfide reductase family protein [Flavivirga aquimarina]MDO5970916.1 TlpA disulfide reductase family protein [Flavivirga aquimarina]
MKSTHLHFFIISILLLSFSCMENNADKGIHLGALHLSKETPKQGDSLVIKYSKNDSILLIDEPLEGVFYYAVQNKFYPTDINFVNTKNIYESSIIVPDSATAIAFTFSTKDKTDNNNKKGYIFPIYNNKDEIILGSHLSQGFYYLNKGKQHGLEKDISEALALIEKDMAHFPKLNTSYLLAVNRNDKEKAKEIIKKQTIDYEKKEGLNQEDYTTLSLLYDLAEKRNKADSINNIAVKKFPDGNAAKSKMLRDFFKEKDPLKKKEIYKNYVATYKKPDDYMLRTLANVEKGNNNTDGFFKYTNQISNKRSKASLYNNVAWNLALKGKDLDFAEKLSKNALDIVQNSKNNLTSKSDYLTVKQYLKNLKSNYTMYADTYALILFKQGHIKDAIKYQEEITRELVDGNGDPQNMNSRLLEFLIADKQYNKAEKEALRFLNKGCGDNKVKEYYRQAYIENKGSEEGLNAIVSKLEKKHEKLIFEKFKKKILNEEASQFTLNDLDGNTVSLSSLKGQVIILDFWATWCGPCKASFPSMQTAVNKYKNTNVKFLFVDTWEKGDEGVRRKNAQDFIKKNNYNFQVLLDNPIKEGSNKFFLADAYKVSGIPTKIIIGSDGKIKFKSVGGKGSITELDIMIKLAQS